MKKGTAISIGLIVLGFIFECLYLNTDVQFFIIKFWLLGIICIISGFLGLWLSTFAPLLDERAKKLGDYKKKNISRQSKTDKVI